MIRGLSGAACVVLTMIGWLLPAPALADDDSGWKEFDILNGRLLMSAPATADQEKVPAGNIMAADPSADRVTQIRVPAAGTEIVVQVQELFALYPKDPERFFHDTVWGGETPAGAPQPGNIGVTAPLTAYGVAQGSYPHPSGNNVLASLLVAQADGTAQYVYIMTWNVDAETLKQVSEIAERMVMSLQAGPRQGLLSGKEALLATVPRENGEARTLRLHLPEGFTFSTDRGPDFTVHRIGRLAPLDGEPSGELGIYIGGHPGHQFAQMGLSPEDLVSVPATILGSDREWLEARIEDSGRGPDWIHREAIVALEPADFGRKMHIFFSAPDGSEELASFTRIAEQGLTLE